jgi:hypothetical protein
MKKLQRKPKTEIGEPFVALRRSMYKSKVFRALSPWAQILLRCLEDKHLETGGKENGRLSVSYTDFEAWGIRRASIPDLLQEVIDFGFVKKIKKGWFSPERKYKSEYLLTYVEDAYGNKPTDEWRNVVVAVTPKKRRKRKANGAATRRTGEPCGTLTGRAGEPCTRRTGATLVAFPDKTRR